MPGQPTSLQSGAKVLASTVYPDAVAVFAANGWTTTEWDNLYEYFTGPGADSPGGPSVANSLRNPPAAFVTPIPPALVRDLHARHGKHTAGVLAVTWACGASSRFTLAFFGEGKPMLIAAAVDGWAFAATLGLDETQATGWALTGYLRPRYSRPTLRWSKLARRTEISTLISNWTHRFGGTAYLWVLAGYTLDEATVLKAAGGQVTDQQLRVMAALNGAVIPAGI